VLLQDKDQRGYSADVPDGVRRELHKTAIQDIEDLDQLSYDDSFNNRRYRD